jgi:Phage major capsid protein E
MPNNFPEQRPYVGQYEANGPIDALGPAALTILAKSFEEIVQGDLEDYFPTRYIAEREIKVEQVIEGLGVMPIVRQGAPDGNFAEGARLRSFSTSPMYLRESDFFNQSLINQLKRPSALGGGLYSPNEIVADRIKRLMARRKRTITMLRCMTMLGGINYRDPRSNMDEAVVVNTNVPTHNLFSYKGANSATVAAAAGDPIPGFPAYVKGPHTMVNKNRQEVLLFTDATGRAGIPWTDPQADIVRAIRLLKQFYWRTNKNKATEILMTSSLYTILHENEIIKAYAGGLGLLGAYGAAAGNAKDISPVVSAKSPVNGASFNGDGELQSICGLTIKIIDGLYRHPETNELTNYWPSHKVVISSPTHYEDSTATLGMTHHPVGESPYEQPGVWSYSADFHIPPSAPGRRIQVGDALLPFAIYPHWIMVVDVTEPDFIKNNLVIDSLDSYGTF